MKNKIFTILPLLIYTIVHTAFSLLMLLSIDIMTLHAWMFPDEPELYFYSLFAVVVLTLDSIFYVKAKSKGLISRNFNICLRIIDIIIVVISTLFFIAVNGILAYIRFDVGSWSTFEISSYISGLGWFIFLISVFSYVRFKLK